MNVSPAVAYRVYHLEPQSQAIAFNIRSKQFMFLEGLSADLLSLMLKNNQAKMKEWATQNELTEADTDYFVKRLADFGFFDSSARFEPQPNLPKQVGSDAESPEDANRLNIFQNILRKNGLYYNFHIDLTNRCNEKCIHCYHPFEQYDYSKELSLAEVKELVDMVYELGVFSVVLSGGECLLRKDFFEILAYISGKGIMTTVFTNGMLLTEAVVLQLKKYRVKQVSISIYGDTSETHDQITTVKGSFDRTMAGIELLNQHKIPYELKCVVLAENVTRIEQTRALSKRLNHGQDCKIDFTLCGKLDGSCDVFSHRAPSKSIKEIFFSNPERYIGVSKFQQNKKSPKDSPCGAGKYGLYCSADGSIYPCVSFRLFLCSYKELLQVTHNETLQKWLRTKISDFKDCFKHDYCEYCSEQCAANNLIENGDYMDSTAISNCERAKIISEWFQTHSDNNK